MYLNKVIHGAVANGSGRGFVAFGKAAVFFSAVGLLLLPYAITTGIAIGSGSSLIWAPQQWAS